MVVPQPRRALTQDVMRPSGAGGMLRPWCRADAEALRTACRSSPDLETQFGDFPPTTLARALQFIEHSLAFDDRTKNWAVVVDGVAVGNIGLSAIEWRHQTAWTYYWLATSARGRGLASQGLTAVTGWAFEAGLFRLELRHRTNNPASCGVATRCSFLAEGIERQKLQYGDSRFDVELHARLATDPATDVAPLTIRS